MRIIPNRSRERRSRERRIQLYMHVIESSVMDFAREKAGFIDFMKNNPYVAWKATYSHEGGHSIGYWVLCIEDNRDAVASETSKHNKCDGPPLMGEPIGTLMMLNFECEEANLVFEVIRKTTVKSRISWQSPRDEIKPESLCNFVRPHWSGKVRLDILLMHDKWYHIAQNAATEASLNQTPCITYAHTPLSENASDWKKGESSQGERRSERVISQSHPHEQTWTVTVE